MYRYGDEELSAVARALGSGHWFRYRLGGDLRTETDAFEKEWAEATGSQFACFSSSGTAALMCCYAGLELGPGDEVIVPGYTFMATALAPLHAGVIPVVVDVDESLMIDPQAVERAITPRTKAISPVHMNGLMADMDQLQRIAAAHNLVLIEDACQCVGGLWHDGRRAGAIGEVGAYSFNFFKLLSCGEGGMFVTNNGSTFDRALVYHDVWSAYRQDDFGAELLDRIDLFAGINLRGNEILAAMMRVQLSRLDGIVSDLHHNRDLVSEQVGESIEHLPYNGGPRTGTGASLGLRFADEAAARAFSAGLNSDAVGYGKVSHVPVDSHRHVYTSWDPLLKRRGSYSEISDPFHHPENRDAPSYEPDMLPRTLDVLATTVLVDINPDWDERDCESVATAIRKSATESVA